MEENAILKDGEANQPCGTNQSEAFVRRISFIIKIQTASVANKHEIVITQNGTTSPAETHSSSRHSGQPDQYSQWEIQMN